MGLKSGPKFGSPQSDWPQVIAEKLVDSRPHAKTHKCPAIAKLQLAGGAIGICTAKIIRRLFEA